LQQLKADSTKETATKIEKCVTEIRKKFLKLNSAEEKLKALQQSCFTYNLDATFIKKIMGFINPTKDNR
jgi:hypothetical protein